MLKIEIRSSFSWVDTKPEEHTPQRRKGLKSKAAGHRAGPVAAGRFRKGGRTKRLPGSTSNFSKKEGQKSTPSTLQLSPFPSVFTVAIWCFTGHQSLPTNTLLSVSDVHANQSTDNYLVSNDFKLGVIFPRKKEEQ